MSFLLDTNVISELRKREQCHVAVARWFAGLDEHDVFISVLVIGELRSGIEKVRTADRAQAEALELWLEQIVTRFAGQVIPVDSAIADAWGRLAARRTLEPVDRLLVATALVRKLTLVTRDHKQLHGLGVRVVDPFR